MKNTQHATTNYRALLPFIETVDNNRGYSQFKCGGYRPLSMENLHYKDFFGDDVYAMSHTSICNGDLMRDPEVTFSINRETGTVRPLSIRMDYVPMRYPDGFVGNYYKECFESARLYYPNLLRDTDDFLWSWLKELTEYGFTPDKFITLDMVTWED